MRFRVQIVAAAFSGLILHAYATTNEPASVSVWEAEAWIELSGGYRDNVLRSGVNDEDSGFVMTSLDASLLRFSDSGAYLMFYLFGEDVRYYDAPSVDYEQFFSGLVTGSVPLGERDDVGLELNYIYLHQVYDASETQVDQRRLLVLGHSLTVRPFWEHQWSERWETRLEAGAFRQVYEQELDDYSEADAELFLIRNYGRRSEWSVGYQYLARIYDTREQYDESGNAVPDTDLIYTQHEAMAEWRHYWDKARHWRSLTRVSGMRNRDNGSGYFDYDRLLLKEQLRWDDGTWVLKANARLGWYLYALQQVGTEKRERSYLTLDLRAERKFGRHWSLFAAGEYEWNVSNDPLDEYESWMAHGGVGYAF